MTNKPRSPVRVAAGCFTIQAATLLIEAFWVAVAPRWSEAAREWAGPHPARHAAQLVLGAVLLLFVARHLLRGSRGVWFFARIYSAVIVTVGTVAALAFGFLWFKEGPTGFAHAHRFEWIAGICSVVLMSVAFLQLSKPEAREPFQHGDGVSGGRSSG